MTLPSLPIRFDLSPTCRYILGESFSSQAPLLSSFPPFMAREKKIAYQCGQRRAGSGN